jgi:hypothetical protein
MAMREKEDYMMEVGREFLFCSWKTWTLTLDREWAQRVKPSDGLIVKEA